LPPLIHLVVVIWFAPIHIANIYEAAKTGFVTGKAASNDFAIKFINRYTGSPKDMAVQAPEGWQEH
jgi:hypothetical protein